MSGSFTWADALYAFQVFGQGTLTVIGFVVAVLVLGTLAACVFLGPRYRDRIVEWLAVGEPSPREASRVNAREQLARHHASSLIEIDDDWDGFPERKAS